MYPLKVILSLRNLLFVGLLPISCLPYHATQLEEEGKEDTRTQIYPLTPLPEFPTKTTPLHKALLRKQPLQTIQFIAEELSVDVNTLDEQCKTALDYAELKSEVYEYLKAQGGYRRIDLQLLAIAKTGSLQELQSLLDKGADLQIKDQQGKTLAQLALQHQNHEVAFYLQEQAFNRLKSQFTQLSDQKELLQRQLQQQKEQRSQEQQQLILKMTQEQASLREQIKQLTQEKANVQNQLHTKETTIQQLNQEKLNLQVQIQDQEREIKQFTQEKIALQNQNKKYQQAYRDYQRRIQQEKDQEALPLSCLWPAPPELD